MKMVFIHIPYIPYTGYCFLLIIRDIVGVDCGGGRCRKLLSYTVQLMKKNVFNPVIY